MLSETQGATLRAAIDRVIPPGQDPGGVEAGACDYLVGQLSRDLAPLADDYRAFLDALAREAGGRFAGLSAAAQDDLLRRFEASAEFGPFFRRFVEHAQEGFFVSPVAWRMIGWEVKG
jgi:hypothetical protein